MAVGLPDVQAVTALPAPYNIGSVGTPIPSGYTTPSSTPLPLELHIDEDGCSVPTTSASSTLAIASSKSLQYSRINQLEDGDLVGAEICHVESLGVSSTTKLSGQTEDNTPTNVSVTKVSLSKVSSPVESGSSPATVRGSPSPVPISKSNGPVILSKSPSPVTVPINPSPTSTAKSPSLSDFNSSLVQSPSLNPKSSVPVTQSPEPKNPSPVPRLSSPVPKSASPVPVPEIPCTVSVPKSSSPETAPMSASPVTIPRFPSPVPKIGSPVLLPNICSSVSVPKSSSPETLPKNAGPVVLPRLSSPVAITANETLVRSPPVIRKTFTSSPRASPLPPAAVQSNSLSSSPSDKQGAEILDLKWPCRDPVLDDALDRLLSPDSARARENQTPASLIPGDEDRSWEEEDGIYPDFSPEGTLTPMTESSWMDECFTPSTCPGTPDAALDLPSQQPSAIERLSASGQVGRPT